MSFNDRTSTADKIIQIFNNEFWSKPPISNRVILASYGYETHIPEEVRNQLRYTRTETAKYIRFTPDFLLVDKKIPEQTCLLEYKVTQTPLFKKSRIQEIESVARLFNPEVSLDWQNIGQMEADAYANYIRLKTQLNVNVLILTFSSYHKRNLLCDFIENFRILRQDQVRGSTNTGSGTPFVNFDYRDVRTLFDFCRDFLEITLDKRTHADFIYKLRDTFPIQHHKNSPLNTKK